jgi:hypothetical protein
MHPIVGLVRARRAVAEHPEAQNSIQYGVVADGSREGGLRGTGRRGPCFCMAWSLIYRHGEMQSPRQTVSVQALRSARFVEEIAHGRNAPLNFSKQSALSSRHTSCAGCYWRSAPPPILPWEKTPIAMPSINPRTRSSQGDATQPRLKEDENERSNRTT